MEVDAALNSELCSDSKLRQLYVKLGKKLIPGYHSDEPFECEKGQEYEEALVPGPYLAGFQAKFVPDIKRLLGRNGSQLIQLAKV
jgi:hypothetical protein